MTWTAKNPLNAAQQSLADQVHFELSPEQWEVFCSALDAPPKDIPALRKLLTEESLSTSLVEDNRKSLTTGEE